MARIVIEFYPEVVQAAIDVGFDRASNHGLERTQEHAPVATGALRDSLHLRRLGPLKVKPWTVLRYGPIRNAVDEVHFFDEGLDRFVDTVFEETRRAFDE